MERKLAAIVSADVQGYSRLMGDDEAATVRTLTTYREVMTTLIQQHRGRVVDSPGDNLLAEFASVVDAVQCAVAIQQDLATRNEALPDHRKMQFRIGINLGDVITEDERLYGDGVNIAARMEGLAEGGGICISGTAYDQVENKLALGYTSLGKQSVKNIAKPVRAYQVVMDADAADQVRPTQLSQRSGRRTWLVAAAVVLVLVLVLVAAGIVTWQVTRSSKPDPEVAADDPILALPKGPRIAVLPFANMSNDPAQEYFSDGLTEDIITGLTRFRDLFVIARNSTFQYKGRAVDVRTVGADLGVQYVLEGSVRRSADTIRVTAQLLDATSGAHLWAETYDRDLTASSLFDVQDKLTQQVVATIASPYGIIAHPSLTRTRGQPTARLDAYECVLLSHAYQMVLTPEEHLRVRDCLERTVALDPDYADAWAQLSWIYADEVRFGYNPLPNALDRALEAGRRAVDLDPNSATAHWQLATTYFLRHELDPFSAHAERALALNPNHATALASLGEKIAYAGQWERGVALVKKAATLNPNHPDFFYFTFFFHHYRKGEYEEALTQAQKINMPGFFWPYVCLAQVYGQLGREQDAHAAMAHLRKLYPDFAANARAEYRKWNFSDADIARLVDGLRKAGLDIPPE